MKMISTRSTQEERRINGHVHLLARLWWDKVSRMAIVEEEKLDVVDA